MALGEPIPAETGWSASCGVHWIPGWGSGFGEGSGVAGAHEEQEDTDYQEGRHSDQAVEGGEVEEDQLGEGCGGDE